MPGTCLEALQRQSGTANTHQEGAALQADHDVGELWDWGGAKAHI